LTLPFLKHKHRNKGKSPTVSDTNINKKTKTNLRIGTRGNYRAKDDVLKIKSQIYNLLNDHTDLQIQEKLGIPNSTYYNYKKILYQEARDIWRMTYSESQSMRALHVVDSLNWALKISKAIAVNESNQPKDRLEALNFMIESETGFLRLIKELADNNDNDKIPRPTAPRPTAPRPTTYPTIVDPNDPDKWITDPAWIEENIRKMHKESK
jgi:hypothetical protein